MDNTQIKDKKVPLRMCVVCRQMKPKKQLLRVVKDSKGDISLDIKGKAPGRGAYICHDIECVKRAGKNRAFNRAFSCEVPQEVYDRIREDFLAKD